MMKGFLFTAMVAIGFISKASAQEKFSQEEFQKKLGKTGTLCDTVYAVKIVDSTLTLLNMGGVSPHTKYIVAVKGIKINLDWVNIKGKNLCVTGVFEMVKGKPQVEITEPEQINVKE